MQTLSDLAVLRSLLSDLGTGEEIGLLCTSELLPPSYDATPKNCLTFAGTGGDGVHFSLLDIGSGASDNSPVVMTVPMNFDQPNLVVGASLRDFLSLGIRLGYFCLEQLVYDRLYWIAILDKMQYADDLGSSGIVALKAIEKAFHLTPWGSHEEHLKALHVEFLGRLSVASRN